MEKRGTLEGREGGFESYIVIPTYEVDSVQAVSRHVSQYLLSFHRFPRVSFLLGVQSVSLK